MRIGIEAQRLFRRKKHGMDIFALELIKSLQRLDTENEYAVFVKPNVDDKVLTESANLKIVRVNGSPYPYWEQVRLPIEAKKYNLALLHSTANTAPLTMRLPTVLTLHDIIYLQKLNFTQGTLYQRLGNLYRGWDVPRIVNRCRVITTVSNYERNRILEHFHLDESKVITVYNGVAPHFRKIKDILELTAIREKYKLPNEFILFFGNTDPKKNVTGVIKALGILKKNNQLHLPVVIVDFSRSALDSILLETNTTELADDIILPGYIPNYEMPVVINCASLFLYPSLRESFGLPILEAMACGVPVLTSNTSSMPEVASDAALLADPYTPESIAENIVKVLESTDLANELKEKGLQRAREFSWDNSALKMMEIYRTIQ